MNSLLLVRKVAGGRVYPGAKALWVDGDFRLPPAGWDAAEIDAALEALLAAMYAFFRLPTRLPTGVALTRPGTCCSSRRASELDLKRRRDCAQFLSARLWVRGPAFPVNRGSY